MLEGKYLECKSKSNSGWDYRPAIGFFCTVRVLAWDIGLKCLLMKCRRKVPAARSLRV